MWPEPVCPKCGSKYVEAKNVGTGLRCRICHSDVPLYRVRYVNYQVQHEAIGQEVLGAIGKVLASGDLILRDDVARFEIEFAHFLGAKYAIGVNSCTDAMRLSLKAAGIGRGDEVITASHTFLATLDAIVDAGAWPALIDSGGDYNMDTRKIEHEITPRTKAIMPVHLNGRMCDMEILMDVAKRYDLLVIEDAAQAIGATWNWKAAGTFGIAGCFSFYPAKILGTAGDGGAIVTDDEEFATKVRAMRDYGRVKGEEQVTGYGYNSRLDNLHAAILNVKMKYLPQWIERRRGIARLYRKLLGDIECIKLPFGPDGHTSNFDVFQNYAIRVPRRDELIGFLEANGIEVLIHWRTPLHKQKALGLGSYKLPMTEAISDEVVSLPMYPELTDEQFGYVCDKIRGFYNG